MIVESEVEFLVANNNPDSDVVHQLDGARRRIAHKNNPADACSRMQ
jgi:hypothetical protein